MRDPLRVRVGGPLAPFAAGFVEELGRRGYARLSVVAQMQLVAHLSRWMAAHEVAAGELSPVHVERFIEARRAAGYRHFLMVSSLAPVLGYLRELDVTAAPASVSPVSPVELLVERYRGYLTVERGLAATTVRLYERVARRFLGAVPAPAGVLDLAGLTGGRVGGFVLAECGRCGPGSAGNVVVALRSLLRFLHVEGLTGGELAAAVPAVAPRPRGLPRALAPRAVARLLASCDRRSAKGRRDFAVLMVLSRLGLRAAEVSAIELGDVDWRAGELVVRGKARRRDRMPLPVDVGEALAAYLQRGRSRIDSERLFMRVVAPIAPLTSDAVSEIVRHACRRSGLPVVGAHALRHTAATETLRAGGSLAEIGQLLRQQTAFTTAIYARVDRAALRELARPWPEPTR
jgi:site-specific recombinase XerD